MTVLKKEEIIDLLSSKYLIGDLNYILINQQI